MEAGEPLSISYVNEYWPRAVRQRVLKLQYGFDCVCDRCKKEAELDTRAQELDTAARSAEQPEPPAPQPDEPEETPFEPFLPMLLARSAGS